jgi:hypothetical protein
MDRNAKRRLVALGLALALAMAPGLAWADHAGAALGLGGKAGAWTAITDSLARLWSHLAAWAGFAGGGAGAGIGGGGARPGFLAKEGPATDPLGQPAANPCGDGACTDDGPDQDPLGQPATDPCGSGGCTDDGPAQDPLG